MPPPKVLCIVLFVLLFSNLFAQLGDECPCESLSAQSNMMAWDSPSSYYVSSVPQAQVIQPVFESKETISEEVSQESFDEEIKQLEADILKEKRASFKKKKKRWKFKPLKRNRRFIKYKGQCPSLDIKFQL